MELNQGADLTCLGNEPPLQQFSLLPQFFSLNSASELSHQLLQLSPAALAYVGDAVYELFIRTYYLLPPKRLQLYHNQVVAQVRAERQAQHLQSLQLHLTSEELEVVRRGRNAASKRSKRADPNIYQQATGLEALLGYLYIKDAQRLTQLLALLQLESSASSS